MTAKEKIELLKNVIDSIENYSDDRAGHGICFAIETKLTDKERLKYNPYKSLKFLGIEKPKVNKDDIYWFPLDKLGDKKRIALLNKAIKKLKCK